MQATGGALLITADHGNADEMLEDDGSPDTAHSLNPVPVIVTVEGLTLRSGGALADVAPTLLELLGAEQPAAMTGRSLIDRLTAGSRLLGQLVDEPVGGPEVHPSPLLVPLAREHDLGARGLELGRRGVEVLHEEPGDGMGEMRVELALGPEHLDGRRRRGRAGR